MAIKLYQSQTSMFCEKVRIVLAMKNVSYDIVDVRKDDRKSLIAYTNHRKVPVMDHNGQCIIDSTFITAFLEEKYPEKTVYPKEVSEKGLCLMIEDWADEVLNQAIRHIRHPETPEARIDAENTLKIHFQTLDQFLTGKQFIFRQMTIADISIFTQLHYLYTVIKFEIPKEYKNLCAWMDFMRASLSLSSLTDIAA